MDPERKMIKLLLEHGADPNRQRRTDEQEQEQEQTGGYPLHFVFNPGVVELLVKNGAHTDLENISALHQQMRKLRASIADRVCMPCTVEELVAKATDFCMMHGADISIRSGCAVRQWSIRPRI